ncbi:MAG: hypothetical protein A3G49_03530 [Candidatus Sungbacteria bacterium RIFCSPLOWO2_12_FULL_41_11]|uniref:NYN domain-containing protein n=1 Tax=Candidatus Sungbacteria bacterium RIFCSPLOWO2_12_FULL_41_11 TaxID=1802286 RepID=A0A1G2LVE5_9BACT|nr:MAG: hypothetical protein A3D41_04010 [Candidatus Sungbacteria bacterium RIFCSPHIGHO2_02_FULL_41_12b]OHA14771.1 MAG: hypothetical protein A3G49_03530 [Candidatus Sungbacteria bacterium RIFCSPLOWO2_12_FULL_41_11]
MSIIKHKSQRVAVLIDVQNMYHSAKNLFRSRVNFNEILKTAVGGRQLIRAIAYVIRTESGEEKTFFEALTKMGVETKVKDLQIFAGGVKKADWDVGMAVDAVSLSEKVDALVLVTGDGDFVPLVEFLKGGRAQAEIMAFGRSTSQRLKEAADDFTDLGEDQKYLIKSKR